MQHLTVTDGDTSETADVVQLYEHRGDTFAEVEGDSLSGFVKVPEGVSEQFTLVCLDCGDYDDVKEELVDIKEHTVGHEGSAELLKKIHEFKTNHDPFIRDGA